MQYTTGDWRGHVRRALAGVTLDPVNAEEIVTELVHHLEDRYRQALAEGATEDEARSRALDELTDAHALVEELNSVERLQPTRLVEQRPVSQRSGGMVMRMRGLLQDWRYACRMLVRDPWFTALVVITLALGIGANGAIFSVVHAVLLRELPYARPGELVMVWESRPKEGVYENVVSPADFLDWRARQQVFDGIAAQSGTRQTLASAAGEAEQIGVANVSASFFGVLGVTPALGRDFRAEEEQAGRNRVVMLNHGFWQRRFGANPNVVGTSITLDGQALEVIGVLPASFRFVDESIELWSPLDFTAKENQARFNHFLFVFARLKPGVTVERAQQNMDVIARQLQQEVELQNQGHGAHVIPLRDQLVGSVRSPLVVLMAAVAFILLIGCVNVANLLLARGASRAKEIAVRSALGAGRGRIVQQLVVECLALATLSAIVALPLAMWGARVLRTFVPAEIPRLNDAGLNPMVVGFMAIVAFATALLFAFAPALQVSKLHLTDALKESGGMTGPSRQRLRKALVVAEIALAFVLLVGAGLMTRTLINLINVDTGFESQSVVTVPISLAGSSSHTTPQARAAFFRELSDNLQAQPGVRSVGYTSHVPMSGADSRQGLGIEGREREPGGQPVRAHWRVVTPGYFSAMRIRLARGRFPTASEVDTQASVAVINRTAAERYWRGVNPIGKRLQMLTPEYREIVGVVDDVRHWGPASPVNPEVYLPGVRTSANLVVRAAGSSSAIAGTVREQIQKLSPGLAVTNMRTMDEIRGKAVASPRFYLILLGIFASVGLILAIVGVYGVVSYTVAQSRIDIGIRMAIGARGNDVVRMFVDEGLVLTGIGLALGAIGAFVLTRVMAGLLFGVTATDVPTFAAMALVIGVVGFLACYVPARRAARVDPLMALRRG
jgi:putative ABC transport system permease protein